MGTIDIVKIIKKTQKDNIAMIKIGKKIYTYGKDACIVSYIFKYKIKLINNNMYVCSFPKEKLDKIMYTFENKKINYVVLDRKHSYRLDEEYQDEKCNNYNEYLEKSIKYVKRKNQIDMIYNTLIKDIESNQFDEKIIEIKKIVNIGHICRVVASRSVNVNSDNANFNVANVGNSEVNSNNYNLCNSNASEGNDNGDIGTFGVRPIASTNCGYTNIVCVRDNVETVYVH